MTIIYEPKSKAREYSPLAINLYTGCLHRCGYCYAPGVFRKKWKDFRENVQPRDKLLEKLATQCKKIKGDPRDILLCFGCDPYQPLPVSLDITREALLILETYKMQVQILTKGGMRSTRDFDILKRNNWKFGTTLSFYNDSAGRKLAYQWEPNAAQIENRIDAIKEAKKLGIYTWISVEPVIHPAQALHVIRELRDMVDHWKIGKINYHKYIEERIDWADFLSQVEKLLFGKNYYIKKDLWEAAGRKREEFPG